MRTLSLLRHAKSSWDDPTQSDHDRPLNARGRRDAPRIAQFMRLNGLKPDLVLSSDAVRTQQTLDLILAELEGALPQVVTDGALYLAEPAAILKLIAKVDRAAQHCMVVGHNPGLHDLAIALAGSGVAGSLAALHQRFPTSSLAVLEFDSASWRGIALEQCHLRDFVTPKTM